MIAISLAHLRDRAATVIHVVGARSIHVFSIEFPQPSVVKLVLADESNLVGVVLASVGHVPGLHLASLGVQVLERTLSLNIGVHAWVEAGDFLDAAVTCVDERCRIGKVAWVLAV